MCIQSYVLIDTTEASRAQHPVQDIRVRLAVTSGKSSRANATVARIATQAPLYGIARQLRHVNSIAQPDSSCTGNRGTRYAGLKRAACPGAAGCLQPGTVNR